MSPNVGNWLVRIAAVIAALVAGALLWRSIGPEGGASKLPLSWFVIVAAVSGALANEPSQPSERRELTDQKTETKVYFLLWKAAVAIVFAMLLLLLFMSTLVSGELFPSFTNTSAGFVDMTAFLTQVDPETNADVAKVLVWSFIAGYSERFVPNLLEKLTAKDEMPEQDVPGH